LLHAALQHIAHVQLFGDLGQRLVLAGGGRASRDDEQAADLGQDLDGIVGHDIAQIVLRGVAAQVGEWQDRDGRLLRGGRRHGG
jgi:hypothetical protein